VDKAARSGNREAFKFPRSMMSEDHLEFSFSGLKSAAMRCVQELKGPLDNQTKADLSASYQEAICDVLLAKLKLAQKRTSIKNIAISGGVSANSRLRHLASEWCETSGHKLRIPALKYCTDNAAMIAITGLKQSKL